jgi:hypothetical protein
MGKAFRLQTRGLIPLGPVVVVLQGFAATTSDTLKLSFLCGIQNIKST